MSNIGKNSIKIELINKINNILNENQVQEIDNLTTIVHLLTFKTNSYEFV